MRRNVYSKRVELYGEEHEDTLKEAVNYGNCLGRSERLGEAKSLLRKTVPVARRVFGDNNEVTLTMRLIYAAALYSDDSATLDDLREAVTTLEDTERIVRRVFGGAHPITARIEGDLQNARAALRARETPSPSPARDV